MRTGPQKTATKGIPLAVAIPIAFLLAAGSAAAQGGFFLRYDDGVTGTSRISVTGSDNDWGTRCDLIINPEQLEVGSECDQAPPRSEWAQDFGGGEGPFQGFALGYRFGRLRFEVETSDLNLVYDETAGINILDPTTREKGEQEIERAFGGVDDLSATNVFGNLYWDFGRDGGTFHPFVGVGAGYSRVSLDYWTYWKRNDDPQFITTFEDPFLKAKLAGTTTIGRGRSNDWVAAYQGFAGVEWDLTGRIALTVRGHAIFFGTFVSEPREWDELRSHQSEVGRGEKVLYIIESEGNRLYGLTFGLKFQF